MRDGGRSHSRIRRGRLAALLFPIFGSPLRRLPNRCRDLRLLRPHDIVLRVVHGMDPVHLLRGRMTLLSSGLGETDHEDLTTAAEIGQISWAMLALIERAYMGIIMYRTWVQLTDCERLSLGSTSQTSAQRLLVEGRK